MGIHVCVQWAGITSGVKNEYKRTTFGISLGLQGNTTFDPKGDVGIGFNWLGRIF
jgi:hypothetical protein